jgi:hypothetical protein
MAFLFAIPVAMVWALMCAVGALAAIPVGTVLLAAWVVWALICEVRSGARRA